MLFICSFDVGEELSQQINKILSWSIESIVCFWSRISW